MVKKYLVIYCLITIILSCTNKTNKIKITVPENNPQQIELVNNDSSTNHYQTIIEETKLAINDTTYKFNFKNYNQFKLNDTIRIDINRNGIIDEIFYQKNDSCSKILIKEKGVQLLGLGCGNNDLDYPESVDWVDLWCVVNDQSVWKMLFLENGDIDKDTIVKIKGPSLYLEKIEVGGGLLTFRNGKFDWIHQSD